MKKKSATTMLVPLLLATGLAYASGSPPAWVFQAENVVAQTDAPNFDKYYGAATLQRSRIGVRGRVMAKVDMAGMAYTVWLVIFNNPEYCATSPCGEADLPEFAGGSGDPRVDVAVLNGGGMISAADGNGGGVLNMDFGTAAGRVPSGLCCFGALARRNGHKSEVHIVIDRHPPPPDPMDEFYWTTHLTTPFMGHRFAIFLPVD